jgi:hypothetical protein
MVILAGRIESGWIHLALFRPAESGPHLLRSASLPADEHGGLRPLLRRFLAEDLPALRAAWISAPGPIEGLAGALGPVEVEVVADAGDAGDTTLQGLALQAMRRMEGGAG